MSYEHTRSKEELISAMASEKGSPKFVFFWGHTQKSPGLIDKSCFSQWYPSAFFVDDIEYRTAEHYMMAEKARLFGDTAVLEEVLQVEHPHDAKKLGRKVANFDDKKWNQARFEFVVTGNIAKFSQDENLQEYLLATGDRVLVESSPRDRIWGIGMGQNNPDAEYPAKWRGQNLLGFALMAARMSIRSNIPAIQ